MLIEYIAIDLRKKKLRGVLETASLSEAKMVLKERKYFILSLKERKQSFIEQMYPTRKAKLNFDSLVDFTRQMGIMTNAGLSLVDSLNIISTQSRDVPQRAVVQKLEEHIKNGNPMSVAMADFHESFPNYYISLIKAGESSGKLDDVFLRLADNLEKAKEYKSKVTGALIYPAVIVIGILVVAFIMMTFVLPKLLDLYKNFNVTLPFTTQMVIGLSNFMQNYWIIVLIFVFLSIGVVRFLLNNPQNQRALDYYMLKVPVFGGIIQKSVLVESTRTLSILITSGVPILEAINIVKSTTSNMLYREAYESVYSDIEKGRNLGDALSETDLFPTIFVQMASVGERTGKLDDTLMRLSIYFQMESEIAIKTAMTLIEPLILVVLGVGVGFLVLSVLTPIYNLTSSFGAGQ